MNRYLLLSCAVYSTPFCYTVLFFICFYLVVGCLGEDQVGPAAGYLRAQDAAAAGHAPKIREDKGTWRLLKIVKGCT